MSDFNFLPVLWIIYLLLFLHLLPISFFEPTTLIIQKGGLLLYSLLLSVCLMDFGKISLNANVVKAGYISTI